MDAERSGPACGAVERYFSFNFGIPRLHATHAFHVVQSEHLHVAGEAVVSAAKCSQGLAAAAGWLGTAL